VDAARSRLRAAENLLRPADKQTLAKWLATLGVLCAGQMSADDAKTKIAAYVPLLDVPAAILTKQTLQDAGREFKWFPSFAELAAFMDRQSWPLRKLAARLRRIAEMAPAIEHREGGDWSELTPEQKAELDAKLQAVKNKLGLSNLMR
jgi:hypothetical protein